MPLIEAGSVYLMSGEVAGAGQLITSGKLIRSGASSIPASPRLQYTDSERSIS